MQTKKTYDAFLAVNKADSAAAHFVRSIAKWLEDHARFTVWLEEWEMIPGTPWMESRESALENSNCCVVFIGSEGIGPWQNESWRSAYETFVEKKRLRVIPAILPGGPTEEVDLPPPFRRVYYLTFRDIHDEDGLERLKKAIKGEKVGRESTGARYEKVCPFLGLEAFGEKHQEFFCGRQAIVQRLLERFRRKPLLAVLGPSGSGKSSVVQAGLVPALKKAMNPSELLLTIFTPKKNPVTQLAFALQQLYKDTGEPQTAESVEDRLRKKKEGLYYITGEIARTAKARQLLLIIDQFEELFTETATEAERRLFLDQLVYTLDMYDGLTAIILTMRSDFLGKCAPYQDFNDFLNAYNIQIWPMSQEELCAAIEEPAAAVGLIYKDDLVDRILEDVTGAPGDLPLLEYALKELYNHREGGWLTHRGYEKIGGIKRALATRAEKEYDGLDPQQQQILHNMFTLHLIHAHEDAEPTKRRAPKDDLLNLGRQPQIVDQLLQRWSSEEVRLLITSRDHERGLDLVEVAHEALIREWPRVQEWLKAEQESLRLIEQLRQAMQEWQKHGDLVSGNRLARLETLLEDPGFNQQFSPDSEEKKFLAACIAAREKEQQEERERVQAELKNAQRLAQARARGLKLLWGIATVILLALVVTAFLARNWLNARDASNLRLRQIYWENGREARDQDNLLLSSHLLAEAGKSAPNQNAAAVFIQDGGTDLQKIIALKSVLPHQGSLEGARFDNAGLRILTWSGTVPFTARLWEVETGKPIGQPMEHEDIIWGAVFDPAQKRILTWSEDGTARLWEAKTGKPIGQLMKHERRVRGAVFDQAQKRILTWSLDGTARLWEAETGKPLGQPMKHASYINGAVFDQAQKRILTWSNDGTARLWEAQTGKPLGQPMKHEEEVLDTVFDQAQKCILTWSFDGTVHLWEAKTGKPLGQPMKHASYVNGAVFDQAQKRILTWSTDSTARLWQAQTGKPLGQPMKHEGRVNGALFDQAQKRILTWSTDSTARLWEAGTGKPLNQPMKHDGDVRGALFDRAQERILTWSADGTARLWQAETGKPLGQPMKHESRELVDAVFDQTQKRILTWSTDHTARLWDAETGKPLNQPMKHDGEVRGAVFDQAQKRILTWSNDGTARLWEAETGRRINQFMKHESSVNGAVFDQAQKRILTWSDDSTARLWEAETGKPIGQPIRNEGSIEGAVFDPAQKRILTWSTDGTARLWDAETGKPLDQPMKHDGEVRGAVFDQARKRILTWSNDGTARLWEAETGNPLYEPMRHEGVVYGAVFDQAQRHILTWSADGTARLWDAETGKPLNQPMMHDGGVSGAVFDQAQKRILTWSNVGTAHLWEAETGKPIGQLIKYPIANIYGAVFSEAQKHILTWSDDGTARLWEAETGKPLYQPMRHEGVVYGAVFDQAQKRILTWSVDGSARLWEAETGQPLGQPMMHGNQVLGALFDQAQRRILTWSLDGTARLWEVETAKPIGQPMKHEGAVLGAVFDQAQKRVLTWSEDGTARLWDIPGDLDFPHEHLVLQVEVLTGTRLDLQTRQISVIPTPEWQELQKKYLAIASKHAEKCQYQRQNLYLRFWGKDE